MRNISLGVRTASMLAAALMLTSGASVAFASSDHDHKGHSVDYVDGYPDSPSQTWVMSFGGRLYDSWFEALGKDEPKTTNPAWPASNKAVTGGDTWRCEACHGWDFKGKDGANASGDFKTGIKGVRNVAGMAPAKIVKLIESKNHAFIKGKIPQRDMLLLAKFLSKGQYDVSKYVDLKGNVKGDPAKGKPIFQNVCAACHGYDGLAFNFDSPEDPSYVGTEANDATLETFYHISRGVPGAAMPSMGILPPQTRADLLAYIKTLPTTKK